MVVVVVMQPFIHFLSLKGIQEDVNKWFPAAMDNAGLNEYFVNVPSNCQIKDVPEQQLKHLYCRIISQIR